LKDKNGKQALVDLQNFAKQDADEQAVGGLRIIFVSGEGSVSAVFEGTIFHYLKIFDLC